MCVPSTQSMLMSDVTISEVNWVEAFLRYWTLCRSSAQLHIQLCTAMLCTVVLCSVLNCPTMHCTVLHCNTLFSSWRAFPVPHKRGEHAIRDGEEVGRAVELGHPAHIHHQNLYRIIRSEMMSSNSSMLNSGLHNLWFENKSDLHSTFENN